MSVSIGGSEKKTDFDYYSTSFYDSFVFLHVLWYESAQAVF